MMKPTLQTLRRWARVCASLHVCAARDLFAKNLHESCCASAFFQPRNHYMNMCECVCECVYQLPQQNIAHRVVTGRLL